MFISNAYAQAGGAGGDITTQFMLIGAMVVGFYFLLIRPQKKRANEHKALLEGLTGGDEVFLSSGIVGKITKISADSELISVEVADGVEIRIQKAAIAKVLPKGSLKNL